MPPTGTRNTGMFLEVTVKADVALPQGSRIGTEQLGVVVLPDNSMLKFWLAVEQIADKDGEPTYIDLDGAALQALGIAVDYRYTANLRELQPGEGSSQLEELGPEQDQT